jgi:hypothetical protein
MVIQIEGHRIAVYRKSPGSDLSLVGVRLHIGFKQKVWGECRREGMVHVN